MHASKTRTPHHRVTYDRRKIASTANLIKHVSDPTRLQIILSLAEGEKNVGDLCALVSQSQPAVSHHLALLRHGSIVSPRRDGKNNYYSLADAGEELARVVKAFLAR